MGCARYRLTPGPWQPIRILPVHDCDVGRWRVSLSGAETRPSGCWRAVFRRKDGKAQPGLWLPTAKLPATPATSFNVWLGRALKASLSSAAVWERCEPYYQMDRSRGGCPVIDPEVYFKMQMVGFFEGSKASAELRCGTRTRCRSVSSCTTSFMNPAYSRER